MIWTPWKRLSSDEVTTPGSVLFAISHALEKVRRAPSEDESLAAFANKIVRRNLDKRAITYKDYKKWRKTNPLVFTAIVDEDDELIGFFDIFPLKPQSAEDMIAGRLTEHSLTTEHILPVEQTASVTHLHIATILLNPRQRSLAPIVAKEVLLLKMKEFLVQYYSPIESLTYTAFAQTRPGEILLKRCGFTMVVPADENDQNWPLYVLRPGEAARAAFRFDHADQRLTRKADLKTLDTRIEEIELTLRLVIASALDGDPRKLPSHINQRADERLESAATKNAAFDPFRFRMLPEKLEFCDLRDLEAIILNKTLWPTFRSRFLNQDTLANKFSQIAELRNGLRHSRTVDEVSLKEGEAGIIWFEKVLLNQRDRGAH
ncbi:MAG: hypothetical protein QOF14_2038 [Hyphomicrobiales bacterium]|nr:hypothetical protein [Hyphomicrobiales bacterium]